MMKQHCKGVAKYHPLHQRIKTMHILTILIALTPILASAETFKGYECTKDCSGHAAGYAWAQARRITDPAQCTGHSRSFVEGCWAYAQGR